MNSEQSQTLSDVLSNLHQLESNVSFQLHSPCDPLEMACLEVVPSVHGHLGFLQCDIEKRSPHLSYDEGFTLY